MKNNDSIKVSSGSSLKMLTSDTGNGFTSWDGHTYNNDLVRSIIRVKARTIAKSTAKHIREDTKGLKVNPEAYMKFLLEEPNPMMSMQQMLEKVVTQLELNNNAFIYINRDDMGYPIGLYPIVSNSVQVLKSTSNVLYLQFQLKNGNTVTFDYKDIIHLRQDYNENEIFGTSNVESLSKMMELVGTVDQGIIKAIKNSNTVQWLLKFQNNLSPKDMKAKTKEFVDTYLDIETADFAGAASVDSKVDAERVEPKSYMPNADLLKESNNRIYSYFNINEKIIQAKYTESEWIAFYETSIEPIVKQLSTEFTRKLFTRKERSFGNSIIFEGSDLAFASMQTKLALTALVDRAIMSPNEMRKVLNMHPVEHGNEFLLRLDTAKEKENGTTTDKATTKGGE
ncbi:phage portal protein [Lysinibacillus capsici]|nr:phage portal protein [Lysinibacillus capsici]